MMLTHITGRTESGGSQFDFLICDFGFRPLMVIEVNGASHRSQKRMERDNFLRQVLNAAQLPLE